MAPLRIIIVGAGIGGPVAAIQLARNGHDVHLYERGRAAAEVGYAFRLTPNSDRVLKHLGIDAEAGGAVAASVVRKFDARGTPQEEAFRENQNPDQNQDQDQDQAQAPRRQARSVFASRHQLSAQLLRRAAESGVKMHLGVSVARVDAESTTVELGDGTTTSADLVIAADGVGSVVRAAVVDDPRLHAPRASTGHSAFRFMLPKDAVLRDAVTSVVFAAAGSGMFTWMGDDKMVLAYPVDFGKQLNVVCTHPSALSETAAAAAGGAESSSSSSAEEARNYNQKASRETVLSIYGEFDPVARRLVEMADPDGLRVWKLMDMDEIPAWSRNRTVLVGDACHPVLPYSFSGASMAIEDAITLATLLPAGLRPDQIPSRLGAYEALRRPRVGRVRQAGRDIARGMQEKAYIAGYMAFLASFDAVGVAKEAAEKLAAESEVVDAASKGPSGLVQNEAKDEGEAPEENKDEEKKDAVKPSERHCCVIL